MSLKNLSGKAGNVRALLGHPSGDALVDIGGADWNREAVVLRGLQGDAVRLAEARVSSSFVECRFTRSVFSAVKAGESFFGAESTWTDCLFESFRSTDGICPSNAFRGCRFVDATFERFSPYLSLFSECSFIRASFHGLRSPPKARPSTFPEVERKGVAVLFQDCRFEAPRFHLSKLAGVGFHDCRFSDAFVEDCLFEGCSTDATWWPAGTSEESPFLRFLTHLQTEIASHIGRESASFKAAEAYRRDFSEGRTSSRDYSAFFLEGQVPDAEIDDLEKIMDRLDKTYEAIL